MISINKMKKTFLEKKPSFGNNIDALDGIRGLATLFVLASHTSAFYMWGQGGVGVLIFFVLSGFLLTIPFIEKPLNSTSLKYLRGFFCRRIKRIIPIYYLFLLVYLLWGRLDLNALIKHIIFIRADGHLWTIPQEMLFYILVPVIFWFFHCTLKDDKKIILIVTVIASYLSFRYLDTDVFWMLGNGKRLKFNLHVFLIGVATGYLYYLIKSYSKLYWMKGISSLIASLILIVFILSAKPLEPILTQNLFNPLGISHLLTNQPLCYSYHYIFTVLTGIFIISLLLSSGSIINMILSIKPLRFLGTISYSFYLIHYPIVLIIKKYISNNNTYLFFAVFSISLILASITNLLVERNYLEKMISRILKKNITVTSCVNK